jgi:hypothetical protein
VAAQTEQAAFGVFNGGIFKPTRVVPLVPGQMYGWAIRVGADRPLVRVREELILPAPAPQWGTLGNPAITVAPDRGSAVTEMDAAVIGGVVSNAWIVAEGDPAGRYRFRVSIDGGPPTVFEFDVR